MVPPRAPSSRSHGSPRGPPGRQSRPPAASASAHGRHSLRRRRILAACCKAVLFDVDFTLSRPGPELGPEGYRRVGARHGLDARPGALRGGAASRRSPTCSTTPSSSTTRRSGSRSPRTSSAAWAATADGARACAVEIVRAWERHDNFDLYEDALPVLEALRAHGLRIGLVSNGQRDLEEFARHHALDVDVCGRLDEPRPDEAARRRSSRRRSRRSTPARPRRRWSATRYADDIEGARALGMRAILLDRDGRLSRRARPDRRPAARCPRRSASGVLGAQPPRRPRRQASVCAPSATSVGRSGDGRTSAAPRRASRPGRRRRPRRRRASSHSAERPRREDRRELGARAPPGPRSYCRSASSGRPITSQSRAKNFGSSARDASAAARRRSRRRR